MTTNSTAVQKKADKKRRNKRSRSWQSIVYPDAAPIGWMDILRDLLIVCLISPLHDKDWQSGDEAKYQKPHYHVIISFPNPVGYEQALEVFDMIGGIYPNPETDWPAFLNHCKVRNFRQAARYLCHLDHPDKYQYSVDDVISIGSIDYKTLVMTDAEQDQTLSDIFAFMDEYHIETYSELVRLTNEMHPEWTHLIYHKFLPQIVAYAKGCHHEAKRA